MRSSVNKGVLKSTSRFEESKGFKIRKLKPVSRSQTAVSNEDCNDWMSELADGMLSDSVDDLCKKYSFEKLLNFENLLLCIF